MLKLPNVECGFLCYVRDPFFLCIAKTFKKTQIGFHNLGVKYNTKNKCRKESCILMYVLKVFYL